MHIQQQRGGRLRDRPANIAFPLLGALLLLAGVETASAMSATELRGAAGSRQFHPLSAPPPPVILLSLEECGAIRGGDVRMVLNAARTRLRVDVVDNEYEARLGRIPPKEVYEIDVHNRVVDTKKAPFMPTAESRRKTGGQGDLTSKPAEFPSGNWLVTGVKARADKYGPYMISTGAVGEVDVYANGNGKGEAVYVGSYKDVGYAIHSNTVPFEYSKTYGCLIARQTDLAKLAASLAKDREENAKAVQTIRVRRRKPVD